MRDGSAPLSHYEDPVARKCLQGSKSGVEMRREAAMSAQEAMWSRERFHDVTKVGKIELTEQSITHQRLVSVVLSTV